MDDVRPISECISLDAALTGLCGVYNNMVYSLTILLQSLNYNIVHLDMIIILVALRIWADC